MPTPPRLPTIPRLRDRLRAAAARGAAWGIAAVLAAAALPGLAVADTFDDVAARAQALAAAPYVAPTPATPRPLDPTSAAPDPNGALTYDQYRDIRFREDKALWHDQRLPFQVMFFHPGFVHTETVKIHEVVPAPAGAAAPAAASAASAPAAAPTDRVIGFDTAYFDYGHNQPPAVTFDGFAGFKVTYPLNRPGKRDEVVAFLGASYFRALGAGQRYGLSARGLAIDTVGGPGPEEFPRFTEFWLERPAPGATQLVIDALLDSPSLAGAYRFTVVPGAQTRVDVQARLFARRGVRTLGVAPLTSMFLSGEIQPRPGDFRPEVHDSDGLMVHSGTGEWLWRPLVNPPGLLVTSFAMDKLAGFGLMQRDRRYHDYEDLEARYELRPSAWVEPRGDWGPGRVELMELPTPDETNDNVVAYWVPAAPLVPGQPLSLSWTLKWQGDDQTRPPGSWVTQTRAGGSFARLGAHERQYVLDFQGPALDALPAGAQVQAVATADANGQVLEATAYPNDAAGGWRVTLRVRRLDPARPLELRLFLRHGDDVLSETWSHVIPAR